MTIVQRTMPEEVTAPAAVTKGPAGWQAPLTETRHTRAPDGSEIAYAVTGSGPLTVMLIHGWGSTGAIWDGVVERLAAPGRRIVTVDYAGHGGSTHAAERTTIADYAGDVLAVADAIGARTFVTIGHSMGGKCAMRLPLMAPGRVLAEVLIAPTPPDRFDESPEVIEKMGALSGNVPGMLDIHFEGVTRKPPRAVSESWAARAAAISSAVLKETLQILNWDDFGALMAGRKMPRPSLVIGGLGDAWYDQPFLEARLGPFLPGAIYRYLDTGHDLPIEDPDTLANLLDGYLSALPETKE